MCNSKYYDQQQKAEKLRTVFKVQYKYQALYSVVYQYVYGLQYGSELCIPSSQTKAKIIVRLLGQKLE